MAAVWVAVSFMGPANIIKLGIGLAFGLICLSLVPLTGWGGYVSICQLTFAGLGAFAMYRFGQRRARCGAWWRRPGMAGAVGALVALPALRVRGLYLALATMAFASAMDNAFFPWSAVFGFNGSVAIRQAHALRAEHDLGQGLHHLPGRRLRPVLHRHPGPAPGTLRPGAGGG